MSLHPDLMARLSDEERAQMHAACADSNAADAELRAAGARYTAAAEARRQAEIAKEDAMRDFSQAVERQSVALVVRTRLERDLLERALARGGGRPVTTPTSFPWTAPGMTPIDGPTRVCPDCHGSGYDRWSISSASAGTVDCRACRGHGRVPADLPDPGDELEEPDTP